MIKRKDKLKNKTKVIKSLLKDPLQTERQVAKDIGVSPSTAHDHISDIKQKGAESDIIDRVLKMDDEIMELSNQITLAKIIKEAPKDEKGNINVGSLSLQDIKIIGDLANNSTKRKAIFDKGDKLDPNRDIVIQI